MTWPASVYDVFVWFKRCPAISGIRVPLHVYDRWDAELAQNARILAGTYGRSYVLTFQGRHFILHAHAPWIVGYRAIRGRTVPRFIAADPSERNHRIALAARFIAGPLGFR